jgi:magnesium-transporting ATPase (P-type)
MKNEVIPADLLVVKSSLDNGFCYLQTSNLDGETALKPREAALIFQDIVKKQEDLKKIKGDIQVDPPDEDIYSLEGCVKLTGFKECYFDISNVVLRGGTLKNVDYIYGLVIYTGKIPKL